jgi:pimeloyl-ACP methyl ester carboxylesterase
MKEFSAEVSGRRLCGLMWHGAEAEVPTLALHGWLDNAASFSVMAPQLQLPALLAIDMPGHGLSDHRPPPGDYAIWDDLLDLLALADQLGWQRFNLIGHSRGAFIAVLLAAVAPERVHRVALLDGVWPLPVAEEEAPAVLRSYLLDQRGVGDKKLPRYADVDKAVVTWQKASGLYSEAARLIVRRGLKATEDGGYTWRSDPRLTLSSPFKLTEGHNRAFLKAVQAPLCVLLARRGYGALPGVAATLDAHPHIDYEMLDADHHLHMGPDATAIAARLQRFFSVKIPFSCGRVFPDP